MINYLYYKLYRAALKGSLKEIPRLAGAITVGILININLLTLNGILARFDIVTFLYSTKRIAAFIALSIMILMIVYFNKNRSKAIIDQYSSESRRQRIIGSILVIGYILLSLALLFLVPLIL